MSFPIHEVIYPLVLNTPVSCLHSCYYGIGDYHNKLFSLYGPDTVVFLKALNDPFVVEELSKVYKIRPVVRVFAHFLDAYDLKYKSKDEDDNYILSRWKSNFTALEVIPYLPRHLIAIIFEEEMLDSSWDHVSEICRTVCDDMDLVRYYVRLWHPITVYDTCSGMPIDVMKCIKDVVHQERIKRGYCDPLTDYEDVDIAVYYGRWELIREEYMICDYDVTDLHPHLMISYNPETVPKYIRDHIALCKPSISDCLLRLKYLDVDMVKYIEEQGIWDTDAVAYTLSKSGNNIKSVEAFAYLRSKGVRLPRHSPSTFVLDIESGNTRDDICKCIVGKAKYKNVFLLRLYRSGFNVYPGVRKMFKSFGGSLGKSIDDTEMLLFWIKAFPQLSEYRENILRLLPIGTRVSAWVRQNM